MIHKLSRHWSPALNIPAKREFITVLCMLASLSLSASTIFTTSAAALHGQQGLRVILDSPGCPEGDTISIASRVISGSEWFEGCANVLAEDLVVRSSGTAVIHAGLSIALGTGFRVEKGGALALGIDRSLSGDAYLEKTLHTPIAGRFAVRFYFDLDHATFGSGDEFSIFSAISPEGREFLRVALAYNVSLSERRLFVETLDDSGSLASTRGLEVLVLPGIHYLDLVWIPAADPSSRDGSLRVWLDGISQVGLDALQNSIPRLKRFRLGVLGLGADSRGYLDFDSFLVRTYGPIGPLN